MDSSCPWYGREEERGPASRNSRSRKFDKPRWLRQSVGQNECLLCRSQMLSKDRVGMLNMPQVIGRHEDVLTVEFSQGR